MTQKLPGLAGEYYVQGLRFNIFGSNRFVYRYLPANGAAAGKIVLDRIKRLCHNITIICEAFGY